MAHIIIIGKAKDCIENLQRVINVASAGGVHVHEELTGYEEVASKLESLNDSMPGCSGDMMTYVAALEGMLPSTSE